MDDLDAAVALVYAQPPSGFVAARSALVRELKAAMRKEEAGMVAGLRRPTKQAWAVGEAVRRAPEAAATFFDAIAELARPVGDVRQRTNDLRAATAALVDAAGGLDPGEATAALLAVAADPDATDALRRGRLAEVPAAGGFGGLTLAEPAPDRPERRADDGPARSAETVPATDESAAEAEAEGLREEAEAGAQAEAERERQEAEARARAEHLAALVSERDRAVEAEAAAAGRVEAAQAALEEAGAELARARAVLAEARRAAEAAADRLREAAPAQERR